MKKVLDAAWWIFILAVMYYMLTADSDLGRMLSIAASAVTGLVIAIEGRKAIRARNAEIEQRWEPQKHKKEMP